LSNNDTGSLVAVADDGYKFAGWEVGPQGGVVFDDPLSSQTDFTMGPDPVTVTAIFELTSCLNLVVEVAGDGSGTASRTGRACMEPGDKGKISAVPAPGSQFDHWEIEGGVTLNDPSAATANYEMTNVNAAVTAVFTRVCYAVSTSSVGPGTLTAVPASAPNGCRYLDDLVQLTETPDEGAIFDHWETSPDLDLIGVDEYDDEQPAAFVMPAANVSVTAFFTAVCHTVNIDQNSGGTARINGDACVLPGVSVAIEAVPDDGWHFVGWVPSDPSAVIADPGSPATTVTIGTKDVTLTPVFERDAPEPVPTPTPTPTPTTQTTPPTTTAASPTSGATTTAATTGSVSTTAVTIPPSTPDTTSDTPAPAPSAPTGTGSSTTSGTPAPSDSSGPAATTAPQPTQPGPGTAPQATPPGSATGVNATGGEASASQLPAGPGSSATLGPAAPGREPLTVEEDGQMREAEALLETAARELDAEGDPIEAAEVRELEAELDAVLRDMEAEGVSAADVSELRAIRDQMTDLADVLEAEGHTSEAAELRAAAAAIDALLGEVAAEAAADGNTAIAQAAVGRDLAARVPIASIPTGRTR
jgi:hypothetical protein